MSAAKAETRNPRSFRQDRSRDGLGEHPERCAIAISGREFDVFITSDQNLEFQQNLRAFNLGVIVMVAVTNATEDLKPLMPKAHRAIETIRRGELIYIRASDR